METPHVAPETEQSVPVPRRPRFLRALRSGERSGQALVEFALVSTAFLMLVFGTIDFGRVIYMYSELHNSVREGARYGKMHPTASTTIEQIVIEHASSLNLRPGDISIHCTGGCYPGCSDVTVEATGYFDLFTARLLGISAEDLPIPLHSSATVTAE